MSSELTRRSFSIAALAGAGSLAVGCSSVPIVSDSDIASLYSRSDATDLAALVRNGSVSALELLDEAIRRTELINPEINAVSAKHYELARDYVKANPELDGVFAGVPFLLKDLGTRLSGTVTSGGSNLLAGVEAPNDDVLVGRHKKAGLVIFGKTNTPEFGMALTTESYLLGPCRNPWNVEYSTGGSSGGSAAAVAAGIVPVAHATDGGGSIRVPASACGIFGFKPTRALTPRGAGPSMMSVSHVVSRTVRDSAAMLDVTAGYEPGLPFVSPEPVGGYLDAARARPKPLRVALVMDEPELKVHQDVEAGILRTAKALESAGHIVEVASPGVDFEQMNAAQNVLMLSEFSQGMRELSGILDRPLDSTTMEEASLMFVAEGKAISSTQYLEAYYHIQGLTRKMAQFFEQWDVMLSPVTVTPAPKLGVITERPGDDTLSYTTRFRKYSAYTPLQNLTGVPAASIPVGLSSEGLPVAAMLSCGLGKDAVLMSVSAQLEKELPFLSQRPPVNIF